MSSEKFCLRWNDFETNISSAFRELRDDKDFFDVTLACDDEQIQAHKVILSACSPFFRNVLRRNPHQNPLLYLKGVKFTDLQSVLNFMYHGEVNVAQEELNSFLAVAEDLRVKGLTQNNPGSSKPKENTRPLPHKSPPRLPDREASVSTNLKRNRAAPTTQSYQQDDDIQEVVPVKTEPREQVPTPSAYSSPAPPSAQSQMITAADHQEGQLQHLDDSMYGADESYEDYGGYDNSHGYEVAGHMDASKGELSAPKTPSDLNKYMVRNDENIPTCGICFKFSNKTTTCVRNHIEAIHFPNSFTYACPICSSQFSTKNALYNHKSKCKLQGGNDECIF